MVWKVTGTKIGNWIKTCSITQEQVPSRWNSIWDLRVSLVHCSVLAFSKPFSFMFCLLIMPENLVIRLLSHCTYKNGHYCDGVILQNCFKLQHIKLLPHFTTLAHGISHGEDATWSSSVPLCLCSCCSLCLKCPSPSLLAFLNPLIPAHCSSPWAEFSVTFP